VPGNAIAVREPQLLPAMGVLTLALVIAFNPPTPPTAGVPITI